MNKQTIIVSAFPKSGSTWLTRLLADILNCPSAGSHSSQDKQEIASEGWDRSGDFIVRKGHYRLNNYSVTWNETEHPNSSMIEAPHILCLDKRTNERIIFLIRDPRDIIVSACHHWKKKDRQEIIKLVCHGGLANLPAWDEYIKQWLDIDKDKWAFIKQITIANYNDNLLNEHEKKEIVKWVKYEDLIVEEYGEIDYILRNIDYNESRVFPAIKRQSFNNRKKEIAQNGNDLYLGKEYNLQFMRKGIVEDYKNFLTNKEQDYVWNCLGETMEGVGYER
ncbi:MAG: sulfotransferase domain-containing protein [Candidatus Neomarinimicrobiota bacterium]